jgi:hypothetical protein
MNLLLRKIRSFQRLTSRQRKFVFWVFGLSIYRYILRLIGSDKAFTEKLKVSYDKDAEPTEEQIAIALDIAKAIRIADQYIPWPNVCRHQAWQAVFLLTLYKSPFKINVGFKKNQINRIEGHIWITCNKYFITGNCQIESFNQLIIS